MRLCGRCQERDAITVVVASGGRIVDVCRECYDEVQEIAIQGWPGQN